MTPAQVALVQASDLKTVPPAAKPLAVKHAVYGAKAHVYAPVGQALICTLEQGLGADFTAEARDAWTAAYRALSGAMMAEAYGSVAA